MQTLLIVYQSTTGGTRQMAQAVARAAGQAADGEIAVRLLQASEAGPADVLAADAYVFAAPENLASMAGLMKDFFDRSYYAVLDRINGRAYAALVCAGSDGCAQMINGLKATRLTPARSFSESYGSLPCADGLTVKLVAIRSSVFPSAGARTAASVPITVFAPGRLSMTKFWPRPRLIGADSARASVSTAPPGGNGTTTRSGRPSCA
jgi:hypothetical protein